MLDCVIEHSQPGMIFIGAAAVADYHLQEPAEQKLKKSADARLVLNLRLNPDILATVAASGKARFVVGFAAETNHLVEYARAKLNAKQLDMIVANQVGDGLGFDADDNQVIVLTQDRQIDLERAHKTRIAGEIIAIIAENMHNAAQ